MTLEKSYAVFVNLSVSWLSQSEIQDFLATGLTPKPSSISFSSSQLVSVEYIPFFAFTGLNHSERIEVRDVAPLQFHSTQRVFPSMPTHAS